MINLYIPNMISTDDNLSYRFVKKNYSSPDYICTCILINEQVANDWYYKEFKKYNNALYHSSFDDYMEDKWFIHSSLKKIAIKVEKYYFNNTSSDKKISNKEADDCQKIALKIFNSSTLIEKGQKTYCTRVVPNWTSRYEVIVRSEKDQTIYSFSIDAQNRKRVENIIYKDFSIVGAYSKVNKGKKFKEIMSQNGYDVISFANDSSREK